MPGGLEALSVPHVWQVCGVGGDVVFEDVFCSLSPSLVDAVLWLLGSSQHQEGPLFGSRISLLRYSGSFTIRRS